MMSTPLANRIAALGLWAIYIGEASGDAAHQLRERGIKPPIGSGDPAEVFTICGIGAFEAMVNRLFMPPNVKMQAVLQFWQLPTIHRVALWENDAGDRQVVTLHEPDQRVFLTVVLGTEYAVRPIVSRNTEDAMSAHQDMIDLVQAGKL